MDKLKYIKLEKSDGSYSDSIPLAVDSEHVDVNGISLTETLNSKANNNVVTRIQKQVNSLANGSPLTASSVSEMTDTSRVYVNTSNGHWYYYNEDNWYDGGVYQATEISNDSITPLNLLDSTKINSFIKVDQGDIVYTPNNVYKGELVSSVDSITSGEYLLMSKNSIIKLLNKNDYKIRVSCFDLDKNYIKQIGYINDDITLDNNYFILISISATNGTRPSISNINSILEINGYVEKSNISNNYQDLSFVKKSDILADSYEVGTITNGEPSVLNTRIRTKDFIEVKTGDIITINCEIGIDIAIFSYSLDDKSYIETLYEWTTPENKNIIIPYDCYIKWILRSHKNSNISSLTDVNNFNKNVTIYKNLQESLGIEKVVETKIIKPNSIYKFSAHRGYFKYGTVTIPENTIQAYKYAKEKGFDYIETDVRMTSDHIPVICHDETINRIARNLDGSAISSTINVSNSTFNELNQYDYGIYVSQDFAGTKLLTFDEVCRFAKFNNIKINIDCKANTNNDIDIIYESLKKYGLQYQVRWTVGSKSIVEHLLSINSKIEIALGAWNPTVSIVNSIAELVDEYPLAKLSVDFYTLNISSDVYNAIKNYDVVLSCYCESDNQIIQAAEYGATYMTVNRELPYTLLENTYEEE